MDKATNLALISDAVLSVYQLGLCPHGSNLLHQLKNSEKLSKAKRTALPIIGQEYLNFVKSIDSLDLDNVNNFAPIATDILELYLSTLRKPELKHFSSVTDFLTSVAPEFFLRIFKRMILALELDLEASGQKSIPIELAFDPNAKSILIPRYLRADIAILKRVPMSFDGEIWEDFCIPIYIAESKTYFDKNMISGVAYSSAALKTTFPRCSCVSIGEWSDFDFDKQSFASTSIDEIFVLRKQRRSEFRKTGTLKPMSKETMGAVLESAFDTLRSYKNVHPTISDRLPAGQLVNCIKG